MSRNKMRYDEIIERFGVVMPTDTEIHAVSVGWHNGMIHQCEGAHKFGIPWPARIESKISLKSKGGKVTGIILYPVDEGEISRSEEREIKNPLYGRLYREGWWNVPKVLSVDGTVRLYINWKYGIEDWEFQEPSITLSGPISFISPVYVDGRLIRVDTIETVDILADEESVCTLRRVAHIDSAPTEVYIEEPRTGVNLELPSISLEMKFDYRAAYHRYRNGRRHTRAEAKRLALADREHFFRSAEYKLTAEQHQKIKNRLIEDWRRKKEEVATKGWDEYKAIKTQAVHNQQEEYHIWRERMRERYDL